MPGRSRQQPEKAVEFRENQGGRRVEEMRFDGQVAVITGAGNGLGRAHALLLAARGASVVVNDYGPDVDGGGRSGKPADDVVREIQATGGSAIANHDGVHTDVGARAIIETALDAFGRIDVLVCNAGIMKYEPIAELSDATWRSHMGVHLDGSMFATRAAWPAMARQGYGRIVYTSSGGGMYGKAGLAAYGAAKGAIYGFMRCVAQEVVGDMRVNAILPAALTRMLSPQVREQWSDRAARGDPAQVSPLVAFLCSRQCQDNGRIYAVGGGMFLRGAFMEGEGVRLDFEKPITPEQVAEHWGEINDLTDVVTYDDASGQGARLFG